MKDSLVPGTNVTLTKSHGNQGIVTIRSKPSLLSIFCKFYQFFFKKNQSNGRSQTEPTSSSVAHNCKTKRPWADLIDPFYSRNLQVFMIS